MPATDDEVIAVEDLLEDDKCIVRSTDAGQTLGCSITYGSEPCSSKTAESEGSGSYQKFICFFFICLCILNVCFGCKFHCNISCIRIF